MKRALLIIFICLFSLNSFAEDKSQDAPVKQDSLAPKPNPFVRKSWFLVPIAFYQEETSVGFGVTGGYYFNSSSLSKISSISGSVIYTLKNQAKINVNPRLFTNGKKCYLGGNFNIKYYPDRYYGIGTTSPQYDIPYTSKSFELKFQPAYYVFPELSVGFNLAFQGEKIEYEDRYKDEVAEAQSKFGTIGWNPYFMWGIGAYLAYDTRDNMFYPQKFSNFVKFSTISYIKALGSTFDVTALTLDVRQYVPTWVGQVFAWQVYADIRIGRDVPFRMLPTLGGSDNLRGFRERKFTDNFMWEAQFEYRIPIWWRLKAAVFCNIGDVYDIYNPHFDKLKVGYGLGLRCRLNQARVNLRFDVAFNNYGEYKFIFTATEAF